MIKNTEEFIKLITSDDEREYSRTSDEKLSDWLCIDIIANHPDYIRCLTWNKKISHHILAILANYPDELVQSDIAWRFDLSKELYLKLSKSKYYFVRERVACNIAVPFEVLQEMYPDRNSEVNERLELRLGLVKPDIDGWMGGVLDEDDNFHLFQKGTREYKNRRQQLRRFFKTYCLPYDGD